MAGNHVVIVGGGSAAFAAAKRATSQGAIATLVNSGLPIGGCCVNVGCIPSKSLLRVGASVFDALVAPSRFEGITTEAMVSDFGAITSHTALLVAELRKAKYIDVAEATPGLRVIEGHAKFIDNSSVIVNEETIHADHIIIATGSRTRIPEVEGINEVGFLTPESVFALTKTPESIIILGGRYIALECAQMLSRLGTKVTILQRSSAVIPDQEADVSLMITECLKAEGVIIYTNVNLLGVHREGNSVIVEANVDHSQVISSFEAANLLLATGRTPNTEELGLQGLELDDQGFIVVDEYLQTSVAGVFAAGDVIGDPMFVYTAAYEGGLAASNALATESCCCRARDYLPLSWVIFTDPQVCGVGMDEKQAAAAGIEVDVSICPLSMIPRAITARDTRGFIKLLRHHSNHTLVGARIVAPEGSELLMQVALAIRAHITTEEIVSMLYPYLTLSEGVKLACLGFDSDVTKLSCCAT